MEEQEIKEEKIINNSTKVMMEAAEEIEIKGRRVNIHNIISIVVNFEGKIIDAYLKPQPSETYTGWLSRER